jgi:hypothetical protein
MSSMGILTAENLGLGGSISVEELEPNKSPIISPLPIIKYPE